MARRDEPHDSIDRKLHYQHNRLYKEYVKPLGIWYEAKAGY